MNETTDPKQFKTPDPRLHLYLSLGKSAIRIVAGLAFCYDQIWWGGAALILAEVVGILEELV